MVETTGPTVEFPVHFRNAQHGRRRLRQGMGQAPQPNAPARIPRISRLMALAIRFDRLIREGAVRDYADLARLGGVSRARMTQIMDLLNLAPEIQEEILFLPRMRGGRDRVTERGLRDVVKELDWVRQRNKSDDLQTKRSMRLCGERAVCQVIHMGGLTDKAVRISRLIPSPAGQERGE